MTNLATLALAIMAALSPVDDVVDLPPGAGPLPACVHEDGNVDGRPCIWTSKRTGVVSYYVDGGNYR